MSRGRVVFVTRRFWPLVGDVEDSLADLVPGLKQLGFACTIVTPRWRSDWPEVFLFDGVPVVRFAKPTKSWWGGSTLAKRLAQWLSTRRQEIDLIVAVGEADLNSIMSAASRAHIPVLLLSSENPIGKKGAGHLFGRAARRADIGIVAHEDERERLRAKGYASSAIRMIAAGVHVRPLLDRESRREARKAIGLAVGDTKLSPFAPLAVCFHSLDDTGPILPLLKTWRQIVGHYVDARLWIFGAGRNRGELLSHTEELGIQHRVFFPGVIESTDELFQSVDILISLAKSNRSRITLEAMAAGLTVVAADTPEHRRYITNLENGVLCESNEPEFWPQAIRRLLEQPTLAMALGNSARNRVEREFPLDVRIGRYAELFTEVVGRNKPS